MRALRAAVSAALMGIVSSSPSSSLNRIRGAGGRGSRSELLLRRWSHQRRHRWRSSSEWTHPKPPPAASRAEAATSKGFLDTARVLITEDGRPRVVGRWDWHAWQLAVACLPAGAVLALALSVRKERERRQSEEEEEKEKAEAAAELPATSSSSSSPSSSTSNSNVALASLAERVATLELALAATAEAVRARRSEGGGGGGKVAPAAAAPRPTPTTTTTRPPPSPYSSFSATAISSAVSRGVSWVGGGRWWKDRRREDG